MVNLCHACGKTNIKVHRRHNGEAYCSSCYPRWFPKKICQQCSQIARIYLGDITLTCMSCWKKQPCIRCSRSDYKVGKLTKDGPVCKTCSIYFRSFQLCFECQQPSQRLSRSPVAKHNKLLCTRCYSKYTSATCKKCRRYRVIVDWESKQCKKCANDNNINCIKCKKRIPAGYGTCCEECSQKNRIKINAEKHVLLLETLEIRHFYVEFISWCQEYTNVKYTLMHMNKHIQFFIICDKKWKTVPNYEVLIKAFKPEGLRKHLTVLRWLVKSQKIRIDEELKQFNSEIAKVEALLTKLTPCIPNVINKYYEYALSKHRAGTICIKSVRMSLQPVIGLALNSKISTDWLPTQRQVNNYLGNVIGQIASITGFIKFLHNYYQHDVTIDKKAISIISMRKSEIQLMELLVKNRLSISEQKQLISLALLCLHNIKLKKIDMDCLKLDKNNQYFYHDVLNNYFIPMDIATKCL